MIAANPFGAHTEDMTAPAYRLIASLEDEPLTREVIAELSDAFREWGYVEVENAELSDAFREWGYVEVENAEGDPVEEELLRVLEMETYRALSDAFGPESKNIGLSISTSYRSPHRRTLTLSWDGPLVAPLPPVVALDARLAPDADDELS